mmetsp:Transcript_40437/g.86241  ORF Transcript_40437/g.86241 Transcript_40437/m.86241 type:complete len:210 (+) Transcript_40437:111-740(+)
MPTSAAACKHTPTPWLWRSPAWYPVPVLAEAYHPSPNFANRAHAQRQGHHQPHSRLSLVWGGRSRVGGPPALVNQVDTKELVEELGAGSSSSAWSTSPSTPACSVDEIPDDSDWPIKPLVWMTNPRQCTPLSSPPPPCHCTPLSSPHPWLYTPLALSSPESLAAIPSPDQNMCSLMVTLRGSLLREEQRASSALEEYLRARDGISRGSK